MMSNLILNLRRCYSSAVSILPVPVIKVPKYVEQFIERKKEKELKQKLSVRNRITYRGNTKIPVISSTNGEFTYYLGQVYNSKYPLPLQSKFWFKAKSSGQKFTIHPYDSNPSLPSAGDNEFADVVHLPNEFHKMNLSEKMVNSLTEIMNYECPTRIQTLVMPKIAEGHNILVASETGSGKTVAYLAPIIDNISSVKKKIQLYPNTPLGLVITPGRELAEQIADVAYKLGQNLDVNVKVLMSDGTLLPHLKPDPNTNIDFLIASIGCLNKMLSKHVYRFSNLKHLILDEADTLLDDSFIDEVTYFLKKMTIRTGTTQSVDGAYGAQISFISSIYPSNIHAIFNDTFTERDLLKIQSPYLHKVQPHVEQRFWRITHDTFSGELLALVKADYEKKKPVMIFCNKSPACDWMSKFLDSNGIPNVKYHGAVSPYHRSKALRKFNHGIYDVLVCTDLASRGLDTQRVKHVINFDFPNNVSDYILRAGRVGRVGTNHGKVTSFVVTTPAVHTVQEIEAAVKQSSKIVNVDSNIKYKINKLYFNH